MYSNVRESTEYKVHLSNGGFAYQSNSSLLGLSCEMISLLENKEGGYAIINYRELQGCGANEPLPIESQELLT